MNILYNLLGFVYFFWIWKVTQARQRNGQIRWNRGDNVCYIAIGSWPFLVNVLLAIALFIYNTSILSLVVFSLYYLSTGLLYYCSGWKLLSRLYVIYGPSPYPGLGFIGFIQILSALGFITGFALLSLTFGPPFNSITQTSWYLTCFGMVGLLLAIIATTRLLNRLNQRIDRQKRPGTL